MARKKSNIRRKAGNSAYQRPYRKRIIVSGEGQTEYQYFTHIGKMSNVKVFCLTADHKSSPVNILKRLKNHLIKPKSKLREKDEAWLVTDHDGRNKASFEPLIDWAKQDTRYGFVMSNPKFEFWLLLHFEDGNGIRSESECSKRFAKAMGAKNGKKLKNLSLSQLKKFTHKGIINAVTRAKKRNSPEHEDYQTIFGSTTVHKVVERIVSE